MDALGPYSAGMPMRFDLQRFNSIFNNAAKKISSGSRLTGENAAGDLRTVEQFSSNVKKGEESVRILQNGVGMLQTSAGWLDNISNIIDQMGKLAISSADDSKSDTDRSLLTHEFQVLKQELSRMTTDSGKFNGIQTTGRTAISNWNSNDEKIYFSQADGSEYQALDVDLGVDATDANGTRLNFVHADTGMVGDFLFSKDGEKLVYIDQPPATFEITQTGGDVTPGPPTITASQSYLTQDQFQKYVATFPGGRLPLDSMVIGGQNFRQGFGPHAAFANSIYNGVFRYPSQEPTDFVTALNDGLNQANIYDYEFGSTLSGSGDYVLTLSSKDGVTPINLTGTDKNTYSGITGVPETNGVTALKAILGFDLTTPPTKIPAEGDLTLQRNLSVGDIVVVMGASIEIVKADVTAGPKQANIGATKEETAINLAAAIQELGHIDTATVDPTGSATIHIVEAATNGDVQLSAGVIPNLSVLDIESNIVDKVRLDGIPHETTGNELRAPKLTLDNDGNIWISNLTPGKGYNIEKFNLEQMTLNPGGPDADDGFAGNLDSFQSSNKFTIYKDYAYYINQDIKLVKRNLFDRSDTEILINDSDLTNMGLIENDVPKASSKDPQLFASITYDISYGGKYFAWKSVTPKEGAMIKVMNLETQEKASYRIGSSEFDVVSLEFDENDNLYWQTTGNTGVDNAIFSARIKDGDTPDFYAVETLRNDQLGTIGGSNQTSLLLGNGFNVDGASPLSNMKLQSGTESGEYVSISVTNPTLTRLGIIDTDISTFEKAEASITSLQNALTELAFQQANVGAETQKLAFAINKISSYANQQSSSLSRIKDTNVLKETAILTKAQTSSENSIAILQKVPQLRQVAIQILLGQLFS